MKKITNSELNALVLAEAKKLKKHSTQVEKDKLDFYFLDTHSQYRCIYGQMTGDCFSDRAINLIENSCNKVLTRMIPDYSNDTIVDGTLNGSPLVTNRKLYWSPIEVFIDRKRNKTNGNNKKLVAYLKGETDMLNFK